MIRIARTTYTAVSATYYHLYFTPFIIIIFTDQSTIISSTDLLSGSPQLDYDTPFHSLVQVGPFDGDDGGDVGSIEAGS
jgi:hypothetical protein